MKKKAPLHFEGKEAVQHVIAARKKGKELSLEPHGIELPGHYMAGLDAAKETSFLLLLLGALFYETSLTEPPLFFFLLMTGWLFWKVGRSAILGWARLAKLHRLIEEERWEIEHHRPQEKEELRALYKAKGFSGKLLEEAVEVLMADDNRLLQVMLEEEMGLNLESYEHPLKQAWGAAIGVISAAFFFSLSVIFLPMWGVFLSSLLLIALASLLASHLERNRKLPFLIWNLAVAFLGALATYFIAKVFVK